MSKKRISVSMVVMTAALVALAGYALALTVTQTRTTYEAISGGHIVVTDSIAVTPMGLKNNVGEVAVAGGTTRDTAVLFTSGGADCASGGFAAPREVADGDFVLPFILVARATAAPNTVFQATILATGEVAGTVYVATGNAPVEGTCVVLYFGLGSSFSTPFTYRLEVKIAP